MALGAGSVTPLQMASAYGVFANGGYFVSPRPDRPRDRPEGPCGARKALSQPPDESMRTHRRTQRLRDDRPAAGRHPLGHRRARAGHAEAQRRLRQDRHHQRFDGRLVRRLADRNVVAVVWIGYDNPKKLGDRETGGGLSLPVWIEFMAHALKGVPVQPAEGTRRPGAGIGGEWFYEEYTQGNGVISVGLEDKAPAHRPRTRRRASSTCSRTDGPILGAALPLPLKGAPPADWQSQIGGGSWAQNSSERPACMLVFARQAFEESPHRPWCRARRHHGT